MRRPQIKLCLGGGKYPSWEIGSRNIYSFFILREQTKSILYFDTTVFDLTIVLFNRKK